MVAEPTRFTHYLNQNILPVTQTEVRECADRDATLTLASHAPSCGVTYEPVEDLIVSIVLESHHSPVVRDIGAGRQSFVESPGCILITPPRTPSYWYFESTPLVLHLSVPGSRAEEFLGEESSGGTDLIERLAEQPIYDGLVTQLASRMWSALGDGNAFSDTFNVHALKTLLSVLRCRAPQPSAGATANHRRGALAPWRLKQVMALMAGRLDQNISIDDMASSVELSPDHFLRSFSAATGRTPHQWLTELRMEKAKQLLRQTPMTAAEIALELGYSSPGHFSSRFRQIVGMSPGSWRHAFSSDPSAGAPGQAALPA